jgi:hypothetical protein
VTAHPALEDLRTGVVVAIRDVYLPDHCVPYLYVSLAILQPALLLGPPHAVLRLLALLALPAMGTATGVEAATNDVCPVPTSAQRPYTTVIASLIILPTAPLLVQVRARPHPPWRLCILRAPPVQARPVAMFGVVAVIKGVRLPPPLAHL